MKRRFPISEGRQVGPGEPCYIVAEMSGNHHQQFDQARRIVEAAAEAGADAIKIQTATPDGLTIDCDNEHFRMGEGSLWKGRTLYDLYVENCTPWDWQPRLLELAQQLGLDLFSSAFEPAAVDFLEQMGVAVHKTASFELTDTPLIQHMAATGKPVILSTGMGSLSEIEHAVQAARAAGAQDIALLKCTSAYPAPPEEMNLRTIPHMAEAFDVVVGLSDHSTGVAVPVAAVALGASIVEKHFTISRDLPTPDAAFSLEPAEFSEMVRSIRTAEQALGRVSYQVSEREAASREFRRSLFVVQDVKQGQPFTNESVRSIRPGQGLPPRELPQVLRRRAAMDIQRGTPLSRDHLG